MYMYITADINERFSCTDTRVYTQAKLPSTNFYDGFDTTDNIGFGLGAYKARKTKAEFVAGYTHSSSFIEHVSVAMKTSSSLVFQ